MRPHFPIFTYTLCRNSSNKIKNNEQNQRDKNQEFIPTQYANDTSIILDGSEESLNETLSELENNAKYSDLKYISQNTCGMYRFKEV